MRSHLVSTVYPLRILPLRSLPRFFRSGSHPLVARVVLILFLFFFQGSSLAADVEPCRVPKDYGEVVCRYNEKSPNQLYIIGMSHRDTLTGANGRHTSRVQAEIYKIGEWLIRTQGVDLLLPEGFFAETPKGIVRERVRAGYFSASPGEIDIAILEQRFSDETKFINAEMFLRKDFGLVVRQVENRDLYRTVYENIRLLVGSRGNLEKDFLIRSELDYHQKKRLALMLQKIPEIVNGEFRDGHIGNKKALFTIGLSHISSILNYLKERKITVLSPPFTPVKYENYIDELHLAKENFGISVILPRTLVDDPEAMKINKLAF